MVKFLGVTDSINVCDCCGKSDLKKTVELEINSEVFNYGTTCAGRALGKKTKTVKDVKAAVESVNEFEYIVKKVTECRAKGQDVVYGRFYINSRTIKSHLTIQSPSDLMIRQIFPPVN